MRSFEDARRVYSVTQVNRYVKSLLTNDALLSGIWLRGELSNYKRHSSGHRYFTLKDAEGAIAAVMFASHAAGLNFVPTEGQQVEVRGSVSLYEKTGQYQFYVTQMEPLGRGTLYQAFEELKEKLERQGLFDISAKKELPRFPRRIGIATSATGAALQDMIRIAKRRNPSVRLVLCPCLVQGEAAAADIVRSLRRLDREPEVDVIIVGRGGGSIEDLWAFNEEIVARAIYEAHTPIISAVGHETDFTIADFVADERAATPSAAAELAVPERERWIRDIHQKRQRIQRAAEQNLLSWRRRMENGSSRIRRQSPEWKLRDWRHRTDSGRERLQRSMERSRTEKRAQLQRLQERLEWLNPATQLRKGYAILRDETGRPVTTVQGRQPGDSLTAHLQDGQMKITVDTVE